MTASCPTSEHLGEVWTGHKDQLNYSSFRALGFLFLDWNSCVSLDWSYDNLDLVLRVRILVRSGLVTKAN